MVYVVLIKALASKVHASSMNNIYVMNNVCGMYIMLCNSLISILLLLNLTPEKAKKHKMRQFFGRGDVMSSFPKGKAKSRHAHPK